MSDLEQRIERARSRVALFHCRVSLLAEDINSNELQWEWAEEEFWRWFQNDEGFYSRTREIEHHIDFDLDPKQRAARYVLRDIAEAIEACDGSGTFRADDVRTGLILEYIELLKNIETEQEGLAEAEEALEELLEEQAEAKEGENDD